MRTSAAEGGPGTPKQDVEGWRVRVFFWALKYSPTARWGFLFVCREDANFRRLRRPKGGKARRMRAPAAAGGPGTPKQEVEGWRVRVFFWAGEYSPTPVGLFVCSEDSNFRRYGYKPLIVSKFSPVSSAISSKGRPRAFIRRAVSFCPSALPSRRAWLTPLAQSDRAISLMWYSRSASLVRTIKTQNFSGFFYCFSLA
jgi:hypothetical protein